MEKKIEIYKYIFKKWQSERRRVHSSLPLLPLLPTISLVLVHLVYFEHVKNKIKKDK